MQELISKNILIDEYLTKEKPMHQIAKEHHLAVGTIYNYIKKYGIESRNFYTAEAKRKMSEANKGNAYKKGFHVSEETKKKMSQSKSGIFKNPSEFGGHIKKRSDGYNTVYCPQHPKCTKDGYVMEHVLIMEKHIGRHLEKDEVVHHINHIRNDNRLENLQLMTFKEHASLHMKERWAKKRGVMTY